MNEPFYLPVDLNGKALLFSARLQQLGYTHRFEVDVYGTEVLFEPDEEGSYRAILQPEDFSSDLSRELLQAIAAGIVAVLK